MQPVSELKEKIIKAILEFSEQTQVIVDKIDVDWLVMDTSSLDGKSTQIELQDIILEYRKG